MKVERSPFNKTHSTMIASFLIALARLSLVASLAVALGCRSTTTASAGRCIPSIPLDIDCAGCDEPSSLDARQRHALAAEVLRGVVALELEKGVLTDAVGQNVSLRYFSAPADLHEELPTATPTATALSALDAIARQQPRRHVYFIQLDPISYAGDDRVYLRVRTTNHMWLGDRFYDEQTDGTYCVHRDGATVELVVVEPPLFLRD